MKFVESLVWCVESLVGRRESWYNTGAKYPMTVEFEKEVEDMCTYSDYIEERGHDIGLKWGLQLGIQQGIQQGTQLSIQVFIETCKEFNCTWESTLQRIQEAFKLTKDEAEEYLNLYWNEKGESMSERKNLTVFSLTAGIIGLVNEDGDIVYYRQRGITNLDIATRQELIRLGLLYRNWSLSL